MFFISFLVVLYLVLSNYETLYTNLLFCNIVGGEKLNKEPFK